MKHIIPDVAIFIALSVFFPNDKQSRLRNSNIKYFILVISAQSEKYKYVVLLKWNITQSLYFSA